MTVKWALSMGDWRSHAVDTCTDHPPDAYIARCGHQLPRTRPLSDQPDHAPCEQCAAHQFTLAINAVHGHTTPGEEQLRTAGGAP